MPFNKNNYEKIVEQLKPYKAGLVAVTKKKSHRIIQEAYQHGLRSFGENYVQELVVKQGQLPAEIEWHFIGRLQNNKVKYIVPFVALIHSVDCFTLLRQINSQAEKNNCIINCLLQVHIAKEETKSGFSYEECRKHINSTEINLLKNISIKGLMGMASFTDNVNQIRQEFRGLKNFYDEMRKSEGAEMSILSMGMTSDYLIALNEGSTMVRIGSALFGER